MNKRGLSRVITVLLLIFLAIAATIFIWNVARIFIEREAEISKLKTQLLLERMEIVKVDKNLSDPLQMTLSIRKNNEKVRYISTETIPGTPSGIDIISVVDLSGSMRRCLNVASSSCCTSSLSGLYSPNTCRGIPDPELKSTCENTCSGTWNDKLTSAKEANKDLLNEYIKPDSDNRIGLVGYSKEVLAIDTLNLAKNSNDLNDKIDSWPIRSGTRICLGIIEAKKMFIAQSLAEKSKAMIVMSDGRATENCNSQLGNVGDMDKDGDPNTYEDYAINASWNATNTVPNLVIYAIGFGDPSTPGDLDENTLKNISAYGNGEYYYAEVDTISDIYKSVAEQIVKKYQTIKVMDYLRIVFYSDTLSYQDIIPNPPEKMYELKKYQFNIPPEIATNIKRIEIYPIILTASGEEVIGPLLDVQKFM